VERPWANIPIKDCGESLQNLPQLIHRQEPHPYLSLGAPYSDGSNPWRVRSGLIPLLIKAQTYLQKLNSEFRLSIFDAWRPISVQSFMIEYSIDQECNLRGINRNNPSQEIEVQKVIKDVSTFWAPPNLDPLCPPPHSTGAALDLTISCCDNSLIDMGGEIDEIGEVSFPDFYKNAALEDSNSNAHIWHSRRLLLAKVMNSVGFVRHPKEWWHFSYGDQLWAWQTKSQRAIYGCADLNSN
tara:strand:+ start:1005 stop:1724 length:720 start_codon:yes stop_codon:yes gene_type:complete